MEALYLLIPLSVVAIFAAAWIFLRMADSGQFDDMDGPAWSVLHDDDLPAAAGAEPAPRVETAPSAEPAKSGEIGIDAAQNPSNTVNR